MIIVIKTCFDLKLQKSGIDKIIPEAMIDDVLFEPCGYSMNGLLPEVRLLMLKTCKECKPVGNFFASLVNRCLLLKILLQVEVDFFSKGVGCRGKQTGGHSCLLLRKWPKIYQLYTFP